MKTSKKNINRAKTYKKKQLYAQLTLPPAGLFRDQLEEVLAFTEANFKYESSLKSTPLSRKPVHIPHLEHAVEVAEFPHLDTGKSLFFIGIGHIIILILFITL